MSLDPASPETRKLIQRWIGAPQTGNLSDTETVSELLKDVVGLQEYLANQTPDPAPLPNNRPLEGFRLALVVGHTSTIPGAAAWNGISEWPYNREVAEKLAAKVRGAGGWVKVYEHHPSIGGYSARQRDTSRRIEEDGGVHLTLELHFNSYQEAPDQADVTGYEYLYYDGSTKGKEWAERFVTTQNRLYPRMRRRGAKPLNSGQNGWGFLAAMKSPAVVMEPGFFDEKQDWIEADALAELYFQALMAAV